MIGLRRGAIATRGLRDAALVAVSVVAGTVAGATPGRAQTSPYVCNELAARLAGLPKAAPTAVDRWSAAIAEQRAAMAQSQAALRRCGAPEDPRCAAIAQRSGQMSTNLALLERQYAQMGGARASGSPERARIEAAMGQMHCGDRADTRATSGGAPIGEGWRTPSRSSVRIGSSSEASPAITAGGQGAPIRAQSRGFFSILFGGGDDRITAPAPDEAPAADPADEALTAQMSGSYRTLCVRTCDGYFFPISFGAPRARFRTDANVCAALCPGTETRLYFHDSPGAEAEQAIAADGTGEPLTRLPNAFLYRSKRVEGCACGKPDPRLLPIGAGGSRGGREARTVDPTALALPRPRPGPDEDPETQAETIDGFLPVAVMPLPDPRDAVVDPAPAVIAVDAASAPKVRTVGPKFFSDR